MGALSIWHILVLFFVVIFGVVFVWPVSRILNRAGWSPWLALLWLIPLVNIVMLWIFAFGRWPALSRYQQPDS